MAKALYHPTLGFYASGQTRTGKGGDFLTPVSTGPVLGELLARLADQLHEGLDRPSLLHLVEQGSDIGWLARDLLLAIQKNHPRLAPCTQLHVLEPHPVWQQKQRETLQEAGLEIMTRWHGSWKDFQKTSAPCFFYSCELVDSFPVKILQFREGGWREKCVGTEDGRLVWQDRLADVEHLTEVRRWKPPEIEGYLVEVRPEVRRWMQSWAEKISCGLIVTMDYGFSATELFSPNRSVGTLVAIRNHQRVQDPLTDPGQLDLTAHVNFTELEELGATAGCQNYGLIDFARGLTVLAAPRLKGGEKLSESWVRNFRHLTHPSFFGRSHRILVQGKSLPTSFTPSTLGRL